MSSRVNEYTKRYRNRIEPLLPYDLQVEEIVDELSNADPTSNNRYLEWIIKQFISDEVLIEDVEQLRVDLTQYLRNIKRIPVEFRDINKFTYESLKIFLDDNFNPKIEYQGERGDDENIRVLYDGPLGVLSTPLTEQGSCQLGRGTRWCTSSRGERNMFNYYNEKGPLYVFIDRQRGGEKVQVHLESLSIMDSRDSRLSQDLVDHYRTSNPVTSPIFKTYEESIIGDPYKTLDYAKSIVRGRWLPGENSIRRDANVSYLYAKDIVRGRWLEGEDSISRDSETSLLYARDVIKGRWFKGEYVILEDPSLSYRYARDVIGGRWDEAEDVISSHTLLQEIRSSLSYKYAKDVVKGRWLEGEPDILKNSYFTCLYTKDVVKGRWLEGESVVLNSEC